MTWPKVQPLAVKIFAAREAVACEKVSQTPNNRASTFIIPCVPKFTGGGSLLALLTIGLVCFSGSIATAQALNPCDLNSDGSVTSAGASSDVQLAINMTLGLTACTANIVGPGICNVVTVQRIVNASMGGACTTGLTVPPHSASLTWLASTTPSVTYKVLRGIAAGGPYTAVLASSLSTTSYTDNTVQAGATYYYVVRAVNATSVESANSNAAVAVIPTP